MAGFCPNTMVTKWIKGELRGNRDLALLTLSNLSAQSPQSLVCPWLQLTVNRPESAFRFSAPTWLA